MQCHYHEEKEAVRTCSRCAKPLCESCVHADDADYCWSCGLERENERAEEEKAFRLPGWSVSDEGAYVFRKLAAAGAAYVAVSLAVVILVAFASILTAAWAGIIAGAVASSVTYTYGIVYSALVDGVVKIARLGRWPARPVLYAAGGVLYFTLIPSVVSFGTAADAVIYVLASLLFWGFDTLFRSPKRRKAAIAVAVSALIPAIGLWANFGFVAWRVWIQ